MDRWMRRGYKDICIKYGSRLVVVDQNQIDGKSSLSIAKRWKRPVHNTRFLRRKWVYEADVVLKLCLSWGTLVVRNLEMARMWRTRPLHTVPWVKGGERQVLHLRHSEIVFWVKQAEQCRKYLQCTYFTQRGSGEWFKNQTSSILLLIGAVWWV